MLVYLFFVIITFLPMVQLPGVSIPTVFFLSILLLFKKNIVINKKILKYSIWSTLILMATYLPISYINNNFTTKDILFAFYPLLITFLYHIIINIFDVNNQQVKYRFISCLKLFLFFQLAVCLLQVTNLFNLNEKLQEIYFYWQRVNALKTNNYLEISYRAFGTTGSPILLSAISFLFSRVIEKNGGSKIYNLIALVITLLSGARMALLIIIIVEFYNNILKNMLKNVVKSLVYVTLFALLIFIAVNYVPFISKQFNLYFVSGENLLGDYSISYRLSMFQLLTNNYKYLLLGGFGINNFPSYVDSEYIIRFLQFGIAGFMFVVSPYIQLFKDNIKNNKKVGGQVLFFILFSMLTSVILTNLYAMQFVLLYLIFTSEENKNENSLSSY